MLFSHELLIVPESPSPLLGRDILSKVHASVFMNMEPSLSLHLNEQNVNPRVWADEKSVGRAQNAISVVVKLKDPHLFPHKKRYPLKPEVKEGLKHIIENLKEQGLLITCNSPCNTPIWGIRKSNGKWRLVQDLQIKNEAVVTLHPVVPDPYTLLSEIPEQAKYFSVIDLKYAFYSVPLAEESQFLFAFEDPMQPASQLTWTVLPQGCQTVLTYLDKVFHGIYKTLIAPKQWCYNM